MSDQEKREKVIATFEQIRDRAPLICTPKERAIKELVTDTLDLLKAQESAYFEWEKENLPHLYDKPHCDEFIDRQALTHVICNIDCPKDVDKQVFFKVMNKVCYTLSKFPYYPRYKTQESRILTWLEIWENKPFHAWAEDRATGALLFPVAYIDGEYRDSTFDWSLRCSIENVIEYGVTYRLWSSKPSQKQMEAEPWKNQNQQLSKLHLGRSISSAPY